MRTTFDANTWQDPYEPEWLAALGLAREGEYDPEAVAALLGEVAEDDDESEVAAVVIIPYVFSLEWETPAPGTDWRIAIDSYNERLAELET